jgi:hypothetical protein
MNHKSWQIVLITLLTLLALSVVVVVAKEPEPQDEIGLPAVSDDPGGRSVAARAAYTPTTVITVTSSADDPADGNSKKCSDVEPGECTLRRAINQAYPLSAGERPVAIVFDIPITDSEYISTTEIPGAWKITLGGTTAQALRDLYGETIVDGSTQPTGRDNGPRIIIDGQDNKNYGFILRQDGNQVRGVAMQNFKTAHISVSSSDNLIKDCWFGLSDDGLFLSAGDETTPEGGSGVALSASISGNIVRNNVFAGFFGVAAAIRGDDNVFSGNLVGARSDGTVPIPPQFDQHPCLHGAWVGGVGITVEGNDNRIGGPTKAEGNIFVGLFTDTTDESPVIDVSASGQGTIIQNNIIGLDAHRDVVGVCGRGMDFGSGPQAMQVISNTIVETGLSAIFMNSSSLNGNTLRGNIITRTTAWPGPQGFNEFSEDAITYGPYVPSALRNFAPAQVTEIDDTTVHGVSGEGSPCGHCIIELFLDDNDAITETLESLDVVVADGDGKWTVTLSAPLEQGYGLRTMSTVTDTFTIIGLDTGTTSKLSVLYGAEYEVFLPVVLRG